MQIAVDAMGGDHAPSVVVRGAVEALKEGNGQFDILLFGDRSLIEKKLDGLAVFPPGLAIRHAPDVVEMTDRPSQVLRTRPDSSLVRAIQSVKEGESNAVVSAGSTGAILSVSLFLMGRIQGVRRPAVAIYFPVKPRGFVLCDAGANVDVKPRHLLQFAVMASEYVKHIQEIEDPAIGLLNIGEEPTKGIDAYVEAHRLLSANFPTFRGNIESRYLLDGLVDVVVCDGFLGNNLVKFAEGWIRHVSREVSRELKKHISSDREKRQFDSVFQHVMLEYEYEEYGGAPLLGVNGICVICHGSSPARAIKNAIFSAQKSVDEKLVESIRDGISTTVTRLRSANSEP
ncbi:MAG: phosphate acyltransferase PlsX [Fidelibacterota bacterium]